MRARYAGRADFYAVYIQEAHPTDGWRMESNDLAGIAFAQPKTLAERNEVASQCCATLQISMPLLVDTIQNEVAEAYSAFPDRLYVIGRDGRVVYQGSRGPFGFNPLEMEQALILALFRGSPHHF